MKTPPAGWPRISASLYYKDPGKAIDWICRVFGFEVRLKVEGEGGRIEHSELVFGDGLIMVSGSSEVSHRPKETHRKSPLDLGGANTQDLMLYVDDVEAHCKRTSAAGAKIVTPLKTSDYGEGYWVDRSYEAEDLEGHRWYFCQRMSGG